MAVALSDDLRRHANELDRVAAALDKQTHRAALRAADSVAIAVRDSQRVLDAHAVAKREALFSAFKAGTAARKAHDDADEAAKATADQLAAARGAVFSANAPTALFAGLIENPLVFPRGALALTSIPFEPFAATRLLDRSPVAAYSTVTPPHFYVNGRNTVLLRLRSAEDKPLDPMSFAEDFMLLVSAPARITDVAVLHDRLEFVLDAPTDNTPVRADLLLMGAELVTWTMVSADTLPVVRFLAPHHVATTALLGVNKLHAIVMAYLSARDCVCKRRTGTDSTYACQLWCPGGPFTFDLSFVRASGEHLAAEFKPKPGLFKSAVVLQRMLNELRRVVYSEDPSAALLELGPLIPAWAADAADCDVILPEINACLQHDDLVVQQNGIQTATRLALTDTCACAVARNTFLLLGLLRILGPGVPSGTAIEINACAAQALFVILTGPCADQALAALRAVAGAVANAIAYLQHWSQVKTEFPFLARFCNGALLSLLA